eukprot:scaffold212564_cov18-Tisochrysis_lutea.AAC.1
MLITCKYAISNSQTANGPTLGVVEMEKLKNFADIKVGVSDLVFAQKKVRAFAYREPGNPHLTTGGEGLVGSMMGGRKDINEMLEFAAQAGVAPKCETMPLSK